MIWIPAFVLAAGFFAFWAWRLPRPDFSGLSWAMPFFSVAASVVLGGLGFQLALVQTAAMFFAFIGLHWIYFSVPTAGDRAGSAFPFWLRRASPLRAGLALLCVLGLVGAPPLAAFHVFWRLVIQVSQEQNVVAAALVGVCLWAPLGLCAWGLFRSHREWLPDGTAQIRLASGTMAKMNVFFCIAVVILAGLFFESFLNVISRAGQLYGT